jgi:hypothetical protein
MTLNDSNTRGGKLLRNVGLLIGVAALGTVVYYAYTGELWGGVQDLIARTDAQNAAASRPN